MEDVHELLAILEQGRYHVVVGNPPYITVKDKKLNELYRSCTTTCSGSTRYRCRSPSGSSSWPSAAMPTRPAGYVGQITANSFMKREFGTKLIEEFFAHKVELTEVIDTQGPTSLATERRR